MFNYVLFVNGEKRGHFVVHFSLQLSVTLVST